MTADFLTPVGLLVLGLVLVAVEVLVLPGFGLPGVLGVACLGGGTYWLWELGGPLYGLAGGFVSLVSVTLGAILLAKTRTGRALVLHDEIGGVAAPHEALAGAVGRLGVVVATLRPSGVVEVAGERFDAVLRDGTWLDRGAAVVVVGQEHGQLTVEPEGPGPSTPHPQTGDST